MPNAVYVYAIVYVVLYKKPLLAAHSKPGPLGPDSLLAGCVPDGSAVSRLCDGAFSRLRRGHLWRFAYHLKDWDGSFKINYPKGEYAICYAAVYKSCPFPRFL